MESVRCCSLPSSSCLARLASRSLALRRLSSTSPISSFLKYLSMRVSKEYEDFEGFEFFITFKGILDSNDLISDFKCSSDFSFKNCFLRYFSTIYDYKVRLGIK